MPNLSKRYRIPLVRSIKLIKEHTLYIFVPLYRPLSFIVLVGLTAASMFYFIQGEDALGKQMAFFAVYGFLFVFYLFKAFYYRRHKATFNEIFFVMGLPLLPPIFVVLGQYTGINDLYFSELLSADLVINGQTLNFSLAFASILSLPFLFFAMYLLLRSFIRYEFIRWKAHSTSGPPGTLIGIFLAFFIGIIYLVVSLIFGDLIIGLFGFIYALNGILAFLA